MSSQVLGNRDINAQVKPVASPDKDTSKSMDYHRQVLQSRLSENKTEKYVSPSDEIMSPATQKLSQFRNKHAMKKAKPQTLFQRTSSKNVESAKGTSMFADISKGKSEESSS